jgi:DNA-binding transcriptional regulator GbsR (MarR family)
LTEISELGKIRGDELITDEDTVNEAMARVLAAGMPPMAGRMWANLAIFEPPERTAAEIAERLQASRGSVSSMAQLLESIGLIRRGTKPGDRREFFSIPPDAARTLIEKNAEQMRSARHVLDAGLTLTADRSSGSQARLRDLRDVYAFFEREWPALLDKLLESQAQADADASATERT